MLIVLGIGDGRVRPIKSGGWKVVAIAMLVDVCDRHDAPPMHWMFASGVGIPEMVWDRVLKDTAATSTCNPDDRYTILRCRCPEQKPKKRAT